MHEECNANSLQDKEENSSNETTKLTINLYEKRLIIILKHIFYNENTFLISLAEMIPI